MGHDLVPDVCRVRAAGAPSDGSVARTGIYDDEVIARYSRPAMTRIWSGEATLERWVAVELAALEGWAQVGVVPTDAVGRIRATAVAPDPARVAEIERQTRRDTTVGAPAPMGSRDAEVADTIGASADELDRSRSS